MPGGFQVLNDNGAVQIDADYMNLELHTTGSVVCSQRISNTALQAWWQADVNITAETPVVLATKSAASCIVWWMGVTGGVSKFRVMAETQNAHVDYFAFAPPDQTEGVLGLEVFTEDERLAFSSSKKYMRVLDIFSGADAKTQLVPSATYPGRTPAVVQSFFSKEILSRPTGPNVWQSRHSGASTRVSGPTVFFEWKMYVEEAGYGPYPNFESPSYSYLIVDVAGM